MKQEYEYRDKFDETLHGPLWKRIKRSIVFSRRDSDSNYPKESKAELRDRVMKTARIDGFARGKPAISREQFIPSYQSRRVSKRYLKWLNEIFQRLVVEGYLEAPYNERRRATMWPMRKSFGGQEGQA